MQNKSCGTKLNYDKLVADIREVILGRQKYE